MHVNPALLLWQRLPDLRSVNWVLAGGATPAAPRGKEQLLIGTPGPRRDGQCARRSLSYQAWFNNTFSK
jgi:hypothetical protein